MAVLTSKLIVSLIDQITGPLRGVNAALKGVQDQIRQNNATMDAMRGRMVDAAAVGYALARAISSPVKAAMEFESAMADVKKVVDFDTPAEFKQFSKDVTDLSERIPMASKELTQIVAAAGQSGIPKAELLEFTEMAAKVGVAFDISAGEAGESLAKMMTGLNLSIEGVSALSDSMNHLSNNGPAAAKDILDVIRRVGSMGKQFGFNATEVSAFAAAMVGAGAQSDVAATSFNNMGRALVRGGAATKAQRQAFARLGLGATKVAKDMQRDAVGTTVRVLEAINRLPAEVRASTVSQLFGDEARALGPIITNLDLLKKNLGLVASEMEYLGSAEKEYQSRAATTENSLQLLTNAFGNLSKAIGDTLLPVVNGTAKGLMPLLSAVRGFVEANGMLVRNVILGVGGLVAFRVAAIAAQWGALFLKGSILQLAATGLITARGLLTILNPIRLVTGAIGLLKVALIGTGVGAALVAVGAAGAFIYQNWTGIGLAFESFSSALMGALGPGTASMIATVTNAVSGLVDWLWALTGPLSEESWSIWGAKAGIAVANVINWFSDLPATIAGLDWSAIGPSIVVGVSDAVSGIAALVSDAAANVAGAFLSLDWSAIGGGILSSVRAAWSDASSLAAPVIGALRAIDWGTLGLAAADGVRSGLVSLSSTVIAAISSINWMAGAAAISNGIRGLFVYGVESIVSIDWGGLGQRVGGFIGDALAAGLNIWSAIIDAVSGAGGGAGAGGAVSAIVSAIAGAVVGINWLGVAHTLASGLIRAIAATGSFFVGVVQGLFGNISLQESGIRLIESLKNGAITAFDSFLAWVKSIPSQIIAAIGRIDLSSIIKWPSMPAWLGGGSSGGSGAPAVDGARAAGGPVDAGGTYLVGERGPELFAPKRDGTIIPANVTKALKAATAAAAALSFPTLAPAAQIPVPKAPKIEIASLPDLMISIPELPRLEGPDLTIPGIGLPDIPDLSLLMPDIPAIRAIVPPPPTPALPDISTAFPALANLGAVASGLPIPELDFEAYTLPEPAIEAILQAPPAASPQPATPASPGAPVETTRSVSINPTIHITMNVTGVNDPEAIARELGRRVTQQLEGALHEIDSGV